MDHPYLVIAAITVVAGLFVVLPVILNTFFYYRESRRVVCPQAVQQPAAIRIDARAAALAAVSGKTNLRVCACSLWPARAGCAQGCIAGL